MALDEVLGRLQDADPTTLAAVRLYESTHESPAGDPPRHGDAVGATSSTRRAKP